MGARNENIEYGNYEDIPTTSQLNPTGSNSSSCTPLINSYSNLNPKTPQVVLVY